MNKSFSAGMLVSLAWLATVANAFGQAQTWEPSPNEPLEKYDMPPAYIYRLDTSPRMISPHGVFTNYQVNVDADGNNIVGDAASEPCITMDPNNPIRMAIGWRQFDPWQSNCRQNEVTTTEISRRVRCANFQVSVYSPINRR